MNCIKMKLGINSFTKYKTMELVFLSVYSFHLTRLVSENASLKGEVKLFYGDVEACQYDLCKLVISDPLVV